MNRPAWLATTATTLLVTACGASGDTSGPGGLPLVSSHRVGSAHVEVWDQIQYSSGEVSKPSERIGEFDFDRRTGEVRTTIEGPAVAPLPATSGILAQITSGPVSQVILVNHEFYQPLPASAWASLPPSLSGVRWVSDLDVGGLGDSSKGNRLDEILLSPINGSSFGPELDPSLDLPTLESVLSSVRKVKVTSIRGVPVTEYRLVLNPTAVARELSRTGPRASKVQSINQTFASSEVGTKHPLYIWLDAAGHTIQLRLGLSAGTGKNSETLFSTVTYWDFGVPVVVHAPPPDQVATLDQLTNP